MFAFLARVYCASLPLHNNTIHILLHTKILLRDLSGAMWQNVYVSMTGTVRIAGPFLRERSSLFMVQFCCNLFF